jgi:hypothetical protein
MHVLLLHYRSSLDVTFMCGILVTFHSVFLLGGGFMVGFQALLVSGASDGLLIIWSADHGQDSRELVPKLSLKVPFFSL